MGVWTPTKKLKCLYDKPDISQITRSPRLKWFGYAEKIKEERPVNQF